jgi:ATP-dependent Zn protease
VVVHPKLGGSQAFFSVSFRYLKGNAHTSAKESITIKTLQENMDNVQRITNLKIEQVTLIVSITLGVLSFLLVVLIGCFCHQCRKYFMFKHTEKHLKVEDGKSIFYDDQDRTVNFMKKSEVSNKEQIIF